MLWTVQFIDENKETWTRRKKLEIEEMKKEKELEAWKMLNKDQKRRKEEYEKRGKDIESQEKEQKN